MVYLAESSKSFFEAVTDLEAVILRIGFTLLSIRDMGQRLQDKNNNFDEDCTIFEVCNARLTDRLLSLDGQLSLALPCRISVFTDNGATRIGFLRPVPLLTALSGDPRILPRATELEERLIQMVDESRQ